MAVLHFNFIDTLLLCGIIQGLLISILLLTGKRNQQIASYFLAGTLVIFSLYNLLIVAYDVNFFTIFPLLQNLPLNLILGFGPCIYFYISHLLYPSSSLQREWWVHFIPAGIQFVYYLVLMTDNNLVHLGDRIWATMSKIEQLGGLLSVCLYSLAAMREISTCQKQTIQATTGLHVSMLTWLNRLLFAYFVLWFIWLGYTLTDIIFFNYTISFKYYFPLYILVAGLTYWIGIMGYMHPPVINIPATGNGPKPAFGHLSDDDIQGHLQQLNRLMQHDKLYTNPELNLKQVSQQSGIKANLISFILNNRLNKSFTEWVNTYRVEEFKKQAVNPNYNNVTLTSIAYDCGFNSKPTFNRVFKQQTSLTPKEYIQSQAGNK